MSSSSFQKFIAIAMSLQFLAVPALAAELEYPELAMTPRYTERLEIESKDETSRSWLAHIPIQIGAAGNIAGAIIMIADSANQTISAYPLWAAPLAVGGAWLGLTIGLAAGYRPYTKGLEAANARASKTKRELLLSERLAEEEIEFASSLGWKLAIFSVCTQSISGGMLMALNRPMTPAFFAGLGTTILAFTPLIFQYRWSRVAGEQRDYKKRIYAPIASAGLLPEMSKDGQFSVAPMMTLSFSL